MPTRLISPGVVIKEVLSGQRNVWAWQTQDANRVLREFRPAEWQGRIVASVNDLHRTYKMLVRQASGSTQIGGGSPRAMTYESFAKYLRFARDLGLLELVVREPASGAEGLVTTRDGRVVPATRNLYALTAQGEAEVDAWTHLSTAYRERDRGDRFEQAAMPFASTSELDPEFYDLPERLGIPTNYDADVWDGAIIFQDFVYHFTPFDYLGSIAANGLGDIVTSLEHERIEHGEEAALYIATHAKVLATVDRDVFGVAHWALLRFASGDRIWLQDPEFALDDPGSFYTFDAIPPNEIEVATEALTWTPLSTAYRQRPPSQA